MISVFISYGHSDYANLADKLYHTLSEMKDENGNKKFKVFKDNRGGINEGQRWDAAIEDALDETDYIIYMMDAYSTSKKSVCLNEIEYARTNCTNISIIPVKLEDPLKIPLLVCRLLWIDWSKNAIDYDTGIRSICEAIERYDEIIARDNGAYYNVLFRADFRPVFRKIIGREPVIKAIEDYIKGDKNDIFVLKGVAGTGKSAIISELVKNTELVRSAHICSFDIANTLKPHDILCNLAYYLACSDRDYARNVSFEKLNELGNFPLQQVFDILFTKQLKGETRKFALVIDGLDEMDYKDYMELVKVLKNGASTIGNVKIILAIRSEERYISKFEKNPCYELNKENNAKAAEEYISWYLKEKNVYSDSLKKKLLDVSEGNFQYLTYLFGQYSDSALDITDPGLPDDLKDLYLVSLQRRYPDPDEFISEYSGLLSVLCAAAEPLRADDIAFLLDEDAEDIKKKTLKLSYLVKKENGKFSIYHKSMKDFLTDSDFSEEYAVSASKGHKLIVEKASDGFAEKNEYVDKYYAYHILMAKDKDRFKDFCKENREAAAIGIAKALTIMSEDALKHVEPLISYLKNPKDFISGVSTILERDRNVDVLLSFAELIKEKYLYEHYTIRGDCCELLDDVKGAKQLYNRAMKIAKEKAELFPTYESLLDLAGSYVSLGDIAQREDEIKEAKRLYNLALEIFKQNAEKFPSYDSLRAFSVSNIRLGDIAIKEDDDEEAKRLYNLALEIFKQYSNKARSYVSLRDLSLTYERLGDIALKKDEIKEAKHLYSLALEIKEQNAEEFPTYESLLDVASSYMRLGGIAQREDDISEARRLYGLALEIHRQNAEKFPSYESFLAVARNYMSLGVIAQREDDIKEAKRLYSLALEIDEQNAEKFPSYESLRELSIRYNRLGDIALTDNNVKEAKRLCRLALEIAKKNAEKFPSYESLRDLSISYNNLGDIAIKEDDVKEAKRLYNMALEITEQNAEEFPSYESLRDLSTSYNNLGDVALKQDDVKEAKRLYSLTLEIDEQNAEKFPSYESLRDLSVSYNNLGEIAIKEDDIKEAKRLCRLSLEIAEKNAEKFPSYESLRDLSVSYNNLGEIAIKEDDIKEAKRLCRLVLEIAEKNAEKFPSYESLKDLSVSYNNLGYLAIKEDDIKEAKRLFNLSLDTLLKIIKERFIYRNEFCGFIETVVKPLFHIASSEGDDEELARLEKIKEEYCK